MSFLLLLGLCMQSLGIYAVWPSRYNIIGHQSVGFVLIAYVIPIAFTDYSSFFPSDQLLLYTISSFVGGSFFIVGLLSAKQYSPRKRWTRKIIRKLESEPFRRRLGKTLTYLLAFSIACFVVSYLVMGFIPMFADDPMSAKQFKGVYRDRYLPAAVPFRTGFVVATLIMPIAIIYALEARRKQMMLAVGLLAGLILVSLAKGAAAAWLLVVLGVLAARSRKRTVLYIVFAMGLNVAGATFYYGLFLITGLDQFIGSSDSSSFAYLVASGAPDVVDQLNLVSAFLRHGSEFTFGRTFLGGMIPYSYEWNPAIWTLAQLNDGMELTEIASGGLRLPASLWGYVSFGWAGVALVPLASGFVLGCFVRVARYVLSKNSSPLALVLVTVVMIAVGVPLAAFYSLSLYLVPPAVLVWFILFRRQRSRRTRRAILHPARFAGGLVLEPKASL